MKFKFLSKERINKLPKSSGVYAFKKGAKLLYIGKAANIRERVKNHFQQLGYKDYLFLNKVQKIGHIKTNSEIEALILEANLIKKYQPRYNIFWKDDKNYFFMAKTKEDFPRIFLTHQIKLQTTNYKLQTEYVGPFVDGKALKQTLKVLRKVFPYRSCKILPKRPCLWHHLDRCPAPCLLKSRLIKEIPSALEKMKKECQKNVENVFKILREGKNQVLKILKKEMEEESRLQNFEKAAKIRNQIWSLEKVLVHAHLFKEQEEIPDWKSIEERLKKLLKTKRGISRIEAYDVSNIQGEEATGAMVTFIKGKPEKNFYRRFKILYQKFGGGPNDVAMLKEVLSRRLKHSKWPYPDLILVDGGKAQLNATKLITQQFNNLTISVVALAKKENKFYIESQKNPVFLKSLPREIFNLILKLRDEAHRFAFIYHKKLREKKLVGSVS